MKITSLPLTVFFSVLTSGFSVKLPDQLVIANEAVPGSSPLKYCDRDNRNDILHIEKVDLLPNPPEAGASLSINAVGFVKEPIEKGAYASLIIKLEKLTLSNTVIELCDYTPNVNLDCPIPRGIINIKKTVDIPKEIIPGTYSVYADVYTKDDHPITCLTASVTFGAKTKKFPLFDL